MGFAADTDWRQLGISTDPAQKIFTLREKQKTKA
jgi:hypothetical protein